MRQLLRALVHGEWLRHRPVALAPADQRPVNAIAGGRDISRLLFPVSLNPLLLGLARLAGEPPADVPEIRMREASGEDLGTIGLTPAGVVEHPRGRVDLFRPMRSSVLCAPRPYLAWRYATAWRHMKINARRPGAFHIGFDDLKALNVLYMMPRPVYLVSVLHLDTGNMFPMDLVGPLGEDMFLLALRLTSPSIEPMRNGGRIVVSGAPAWLKDIVYRLGAHHRTPLLDWDALELQTEPSPLFGFPVPADALSLRELQLLHSEAVGSHMFFVTAIANQSLRSDEAQLCHVSDMYARWRAQRGNPFIDA